MKINIEEHDQSERMWRKFKLQHDLLKRTLYFCSLIVDPLLQLSDCAVVGGEEGGGLSHI